MPRRAHALPDAVVNGGYAAAGATAASYILKQVVGGRTSSTTASSAAVLAPATDGSAGTIADAIAAEGIAGGVVGAKPGSVGIGIIVEDAADSAVHAGDEASRAATGIAAGLEHAGTSQSPVIKTVQTEVVKTIRVPRKNLTRSDLVNLIIRETPAWQIGLAAAVPCAALLAVVVAARRFTHLEIAKARNELLTDHEQELAEQLEKTEEKLAAMIKTHASVSKEKESLEKKTTQMETKMNQKAMLEIEKLEAKFMMREAEQAREVEEAREALAAVVKEKEELARKIESRATSEADAAIAEVEARLRAEADVADKAAAEKLEAAQTAAKAELEQWRADREEWETITKDNFLAMERELKETKSKLEATETEAAAAADESDVEAMRKIEAIRGELETEVAIASDRLQAMEATMRAAQQARADAEKELSDVRQDMDTLRQMMDDTSRESVQQNLDMEQELSRVVNEASELRAKLDAQAAQLALADADAAKKLEMATGETAALRAEIEASKVAQSAESATFSASKAELEEAMRRAHAIAKENAIKMVKHNERMGRWKSYKSGDIDIPVKFEIAVETLPGQRVAMVGTWNDWDIGKAFPMVWTEGNVWTVTTPIHGDDTYEYKYVVIDGEGPEALENATWQTGNNRALGLNLSLHDEVALVEVVDTWRADPKQAPIILHMVDGTLKEEGSTKLLHDVIRELRTEQALLDGSLNVKVLAEIATAISAAAGPAIADPLDEEFFDAMEKAAVEEATPAKPPKDAFKVSTESNIVDVTSESIDEHVPVFVDAPNAFENTPDAFENTPATPVNVNVTADGEAIAEATMSDVDVGEGQDATSSSKTGPR